MKTSMDRYRVAPGSALRLADHDPRDNAAFDGEKEAGREAASALAMRLEILQETLFAEGKRKLLVILQAMDTGGKDGVIRHVFQGVNPQGVQVAAFKVPTAPELAHDYLWRVHPHTPGTGQMAIFNRSHYEDVLVVRVHELVPEARWRKRFAHIRAFEQLLADEGTTILKFFLHISKEEQRTRLIERRDDPSKHWKFKLGDLDERKRWDDYMAAYEEAVGETSTDAAPWYVVPADRKWYRNLVVGSVIVETLDGLGMRYPAGEPGIAEVEIV